MRLLDILSNIVSFFRLIHRQPCTVFIRNDSKVNFSWEFSWLRQDETEVRIHAFPKFSQIGMPPRMLVPDRAHCLMRLMHLRATPGTTRALHSPFSLFFYFVFERVTKNRKGYSPLLYVNWRIYLFCETCLSMVKVFFFSQIF